MHKDNDMDLHQACRKMVENIANGSASEYHLEQFIINITEDETPAMSLVMAMDDSSELDGSIGNATTPADEWSNHNTN